MKISWVAGIIFFLSVYGAANFYIGVRGRNALGGILPFFSGKAFWLIYFLIAFSYIIARFASGVFPEFLVRFLEVLGGYWLAAMLYLFIAVVCIDLIRLANRFFGFLPSFMLGTRGAAVIGSVILLSVAGLLVYGTWNARNARIIRYDIEIGKTAGDMGELHAVMVSDIHFGSVVNRERLLSMVGIINGLKPDLVLIAGDLIDEDIREFKKQKAAEVLKEIKAQYGVYAVPGNHEYFSGHPEEIIQCYREAGIEFLKDRSVKINESFYLVGRDDRSGTRLTGKPRKTPEELLKDVDRSFPVLLLDHQPYLPEEAESAGIDLQFSGHTHRGQIFPGEWVTGMIFEKDWGYLRKGNFQLIVSSGFGTWGPPVRIGTGAEIVDIWIRFGEKT